jgi:iron complex outermembrane receptor protein
MDANNSSARTHGFEIAADWQVNPDWRIQPNYSRLYMRSPTLADPIAAEGQQQLLGRVPRHRASLRSSWNLANGQKLDLWLKYTSRTSRGANPDVAAYTVLDLRYAFPIGKQGEIAIIGQNLLDKQHPEFVSEFLPTQQTEIGRSLMVKGTWRF